MVDIDRGTRDIAVEARSLVNQHMDDCTKWRETVQKSFSSLQSDLKDQTADFKLDIKTQGEDIRALNNKLLLIIGGLIVASKALDWTASYLHH